jgi:uncharacterized membrane protein
MTRLIWTYLAALITFLIIDAVWLGLIAKNLYQTKLAGLLAPQVNWWAAGLFYALFAGGIMYFAVEPAVKAGSMAQALLYAAVFGFLAYATYDLTNQATLKDWPWVVTILDLIWGAFISTLVAGVAYFVAIKFV